MLKSIRQIIRKNRRSPPLSLIAAGCEKYLRAWHNEAWWIFDKNGEAFGLRTAASYFAGRSVVIWDVGAHHGEWASEARRTFPTAEIHCFEIVPVIAQTLAKNFKDDDRVFVHSIGLSDAEGDIEVHLNEAWDNSNSIAPRLGMHWYADGMKIVLCKRTTADAFSRVIKPPDILKIDVEGHEVSVLRGAVELLNSNRGPIYIQFEYGDTYVASNATLRDVYNILEPNGYTIGRLFPNHVQFKTYEYPDDHFRLGNYIAVKEERLQKALQNL